MSAGAASVVTAPAADELGGEWGRDDIRPGIEVLGEGLGAAIGGGVGTGVSGVAAEIGLPALSSVLLGATGGEVTSAVMNEAVQNPELDKTRLDRK